MSNSLFATKKSFSLLSASSLPLHGQEQKVIYNPSGLVKKQKIRFGTISNKKAALLSI
jgi:hypothetical protein